MNGHRWLSEGAEKLVRELDAQMAGPHCDVLIIGSGYGGAVAAARLAGGKDADGNPVKVFVLERGQEYLPGSFPEKFAEIPGHVRFSLQDGGPPRGVPEGLFDMRIGPQVNVLLANGLGGGSLINAAVMEPPSDSVFASGWPGAIHPGALRDSYRKALDVLRPGPIPSFPATPKLDSLLRLGKALGATQCRPANIAVHFRKEVNAANVQMEECLRCGDCVSGCNHEAKNSLDTNYLKLARDRGARLFCGGTVLRVRPSADGKGWDVAFVLTDPAREPSGPRTYTVRTRRVILAAGTLGSTEILLRSDRAHGGALNLSPRLGERFSTNGDMIAVAYRQKMPAHASAGEGDPPFGRNIGPTITGLARVQDHKAGELLFQEFAIPAALRRLLGEVVTTFGSVYGLLDADKSRHDPQDSLPDPLAVSDDAIEHTSIYGIMGDDGARGRVLLGSDRAAAADSDGRSQIAWTVGNAGDAPVFDRQIELLAEGHDNDAGLKGTVVPNPIWQPAPPIAGFPKGSVMTVHPLGGCAMADSVDKGVVDACGRVFDADTGRPFDGLMVLDGSVIPTALRVNPGLTIAALAEYGVANAFRDWTLVPFAVPAGAAVSRPRWSNSPVVSAKAPAPTAVTLRERMLGNLRIGGVTFTAELTVAFGTIGDVAAFVRRLPRPVPLPEVRLTLKDGTGRIVCEAALDGVAHVLERAESKPFGRAARVAGLAYERLKRARKATTHGGIGDLYALLTHLGAERNIRYDLRVRQVVPRFGTPPVATGDALELLKRIRFVADDFAAQPKVIGNPWRQLSEGEVTLQRAGKALGSGWAELDMDYLADQGIALIEVLSQQDEPNALGDLVEFGLFIGRVLLNIHLLNFLPPEKQRRRINERLPAQVNGINPSIYELKSPPKWRLSRYTPGAARQTANPVLLIHGYGASGSTFTHQSIGADSGSNGSLVAALLEQGREAWVLDLRTSIGLDQPQYWSFEAVARGDIPGAVRFIVQTLADEGVAARKVDVVAHCIGSAMFCVAVLEDETLHRDIGAVVLSQVGPLLRMSPMNRLRGYVMSYLKQYLSTSRLDVSPSREDGLLLKLLDGLLNTFPYPDDDFERGRLSHAATPRFATVRHRADAIFGQLMQLGNIGDETLASLDAIYGWVMVQTLAQTIHFARREMVTDAGGANRLIATRTLGERFAFPVLLVHGMHNRVFDWRGSYRSLWLLKQAFQDPDSGNFPQDRPDPAPISGSAWYGEGTPRQLFVAGAYGHQDCLIGANAHGDIFPAMLDFLDKFGSTGPATATPRQFLIADLPSQGPLLAWVRREKPGELACRLAVRASPARASTILIAFVPCVRHPGGWIFDVDHAVCMLPPDICGGAEGAESMPVLTDCLDEVALDILLDPNFVAGADASLLGGRRSRSGSRMFGSGYHGFAVLTLHDDLPISQSAISFQFDKALQGGLFKSPATPLPSNAKNSVQDRLRSGSGSHETGIVVLDPSWIAAADTRNHVSGPWTLDFALASCQYPAGLLDEHPAQSSQRRLLDRLRPAATGKPQFLLLCGDQVYADETAGVFDSYSRDRYSHAYELNFTLDAFRAVTRAVPTYFQYDDHEIADNWEPGRPLPPQSEVKDAMREFEWHQGKLVPDSRVVVGGRGYFFFPSGLPFCVLDTRGEREPRTLVPGANRKVVESAGMLSEDTFRALEDWLVKTPPDLPKFIVSPSVVFPFERKAVFGDMAERIGLDSWSGFPASLGRLLHYIADRGIRNVVFLSGDAHMSMVSSLVLKDPASGKALTEVHSIVSSGLYAPWPFANTRPEDLVLAGDVDLTLGGTDLAGTVTTPAQGVSDGFAIVRASSTEVNGKRGWTLAVELDLRSGLVQCSRTFGAAPGDRAWSTVDILQRDPGVVS